MSCHCHGNLFIYSSIILNTHVFPNFHRIGNEYFAFKQSIIDKFHTLKYYLLARMVPDLHEGDMQEY